ncbi:hypothetical protein B9N43_07245 [Denitratisoma sp. DHT3]|uniref:hypothetical protein n=1 Tax=Denitratisoma sp. DHT3 TaxID=1981880 RepID=UPI0011986AB3|nr:hypothetical protein [Denitratisoma sp. DHT3]QDX81057.1 hypothetical protein B9N43_07245 [Denitratisoma sp. DHT3]
MASLLSFDQAPPFSVPARFFLTACLFGVAAGVMLAVLGGQVFASRWAPGLLALTHLVGTGVLLQVMVGACFQFIPVVTGANIAHPRVVASIVHPLLTLATVVLATAFLESVPALFLIAAGAFIVALSCFIATILLALKRAPTRSTLHSAFAWPLFALGVTVALGALLASAIASGSPFPYTRVTNTHLTWALGAWCMALLGSVATVVVPMFQMTPAYPRWFERGFAPAMFLVAGLWSTRIMGWSLVPAIAALAGFALVAAFAFLTLSLQAKRRRKLTDTTFAFFRLAALAILAEVLLWSAREYFGWWQAETRIDLLLGLWMLIGVLLSTVSGMLYKIVPFLCWVHIQRRGPFATTPPNMKEILPDGRARKQFFAHLTALGLLTIALWLPSLARLAGLVFALSSAWLGWNLLGALRIYRATMETIGRTRADAERNGL